MSKKFNKTLFLLCLLASLIISIITTNSGFSSFVDRKIYDILTSSIFDKITPSNQITIVSIDTQSINSLGQWPWNRLIMAKLIQNIHEANPASIGLDIIFSEPDRTSPKQLKNFYKNMLDLDLDISSIPSNFHDNDNILASVLNRSNIATPIIATSEESKNSCNPKNFLTDQNRSMLFNTPFFTCNTPKIQDHLQNSGFINANTDSDGILRKYFIGINFHDKTSNFFKFIPSLGLSMLKSIDSTLAIKQNEGFLRPFVVEYLDKKIIANKKAQVLNFVYPQEKFHTISAVEVLKNNFNQDIFKGKFVIISTSAIGVASSHISQNGKYANGAVFHASFIHNALNSKLLFTPINASFAVSCFTFLVLAGLIYQMLFIQKKLVFSFCLSLLFIFGLEFVALHQNIYLPLGYFLVPFLLVYILMLILSFFIFQKNQIAHELQIVKIRSSILNSIMTIIETKDSETGNHILRVKEYAKILATYLYAQSSYKKELNLAKIETIYLATPLHDLGKIGIKDHILQKKGKLTQEEFEEIKKHSQIGYDIMQRSAKDNFDNDFSLIALNIIYTHHEKFDGTGYPNGLKGLNIPLEGRIVSLCDVYDALVSKRCYKEAFDFEKAKEIIKNGANSHFDPVIVEAFLALEDEFIAIAKKYRD